MKTVIILAMHGSPPKDFPKGELAEFFRINSQIRQRKNISDIEREQYIFLEDKMRNWSRTAQNDPFHFASQELADLLSKESGYEVIVGYNEFCSPNLDEALQSAASKNSDKIVVVTSMMTRGGEHSEKDIPAEIEEFRKRCPQIEIVYAWPFDSLHVSRFLAEHISRFI